ncbi:response regulator [Paenibacillus aurantius]|uniref:Response regulator n=1 Tax=Paenibacillus aurantius TaxID=2918900 RepID=A0AA96LF18_9BACL|nr:response regulator [Paenibacillus aurantius]WNQ10891.1 response regulator [Paenibacillus aurantius]
MRRLLVVDDELFIVNGLTGMIKEAGFPDLEVYKANSAAEALDLLQRTVIDIVLTDICMPGMDGLELQKSIIQEWPRCKILFLTGHHDFDYVKEAIRHRAFDYILKTEGDRAILAAVGKALTELEQEFETGSELLKARQQLQAALPFMQKEFMFDLVRGEASPKVALQEQMAELHLDFNTRLPVLLIMAKVDEWAEKSHSDKALLLYAVQNIAHEYYSSSVLSLSFPYEKSKLAWFIQPFASSAQDGDSYRRLFRFVYGATERIQQTCGELLKLKLSFALASEFFPWPQLSDRAERLQRIMRRSFGLGQEWLLTDEEFSPAAKASTEHHTKWIRKQVEQLELCLVSGARAEFRSRLAEMAEHPAAASDSGFRTVASFQLTSMILTFAMNEGLSVAPYGEYDSIRQWNHNSPEDWEGLIERMAEMGDEIIRLKENAASQHGRSLILKIHQYIDQNLGGDLSMTRLGEVVSLNPIYLSRLYKQLTGDGLTDTIMSARLTEAKRRLKETDEKVQDVAHKVGFESAAYFIRLFKKTTAFTPQEYREHVRK